MNREAIFLASLAHHADKWGDHPYMLHLALVADAISDLLKDDDKGINYDDAISAAWLHDVIEDHPEYELKVSKSFPKLVNSLLLLARSSDESYSEYIDRVIESKDKLALAVKISDMSVNMGNNPPERLLKRYSKHYGKLVEAWDKF